MATTTNFGWDTPDDTDLVKDGAAAIRTLGQSIDTSLMDLEGGTTGQVLAKNSNTDMDFVWTTTATAGGLTELYTSGMSGLSTITTSTLAGPYKQLWIEVTNARAASGNTYLRVNSDTGSNYYRIGFNDSTYNSVPSWVNAAFLYIGQPQSSTSDMYSLTQINNYAGSNAIKTGQNYGMAFNAGTPASTANYMGPFWWNNSAAITTVTIFNSASANWTAGTFTVWGLN